MEMQEETLVLSHPSLLGVLASWRSMRRAAESTPSVEAVALPEDFAEDVAGCMKRDPGAHPSGARPEPSEGERREEDGEASGIADRREVAEREDRAREEERRADGGAEEIQSATARGAEHQSDLDDAAEELGLDDCDS